MKVRLGFVSNSSSSSFVVYGTTLGDEQLKHFSDKFHKCVEGCSCKTDDRYEHQDYIACEIQKNLPKSFDVCTYFDDIKVGRPLTDIGDDETGGQFRESTRKVLKELFGDDCPVYQIEEAWYDG